MKLTKEEIEVALLRHFCTDAKALTKAKLLRIGEDHFQFSPEGAPVKKDGTAASYTRLLYRWMEKYFEESGGFLFTQAQIDAKLVEKGVPDEHRLFLMLTWEKIQDADYNENDLHFLIEQVKRNEAVRKIGSMIAVCHEHMKEGELAEAVSHVAAEVEAIQNELSFVQFQEMVVDMADSVDWFTEEYQRRKDHPELYRGVKCGIPQIDEKTFGFQGGQMIVLLAGTSGGKSVQLVNWASNAHQEGRNVLYFSFEMDAWSCYLRHLSLLFEVPYAAIKSLSLESDEFRRLIEQLQGLKGGTYFEYREAIEDPTPENVEAAIRELSQTKGTPDLVVVDYIGNMTVRRPRRDAKDWENQEAAFKQLFMMAKRWRLPILTAQQINAGTIRDNKKQRQAGKAITYDQAAASGGQTIMHLSHYVMAVEPHKEYGMATIHPVKMRDAQFEPFGIKVDPRFNKVMPLDEESLEIWRTISLINDDAGTESKPLPSTRLKGGGNPIPGIPGIPGISAPQNDPMTVVEWGGGHQQAFTREDIEINAETISIMGWD